MRNKIKYQGGITKFLCTRKAERNRRRFEKDIYILNQAHFNKKNIHFEIISLSGRSSFEDQILSIYSFLFYAGQPIKWTIYSDGTISPDQKKLLEQLFDFAEVKNWDVFDIYIKSKTINEYLAGWQIAKKLNIILGHNYQQQTIYVDSDILFYKNISYYIHSRILDKGLWYAPDTLGDVAQYFSTPKEFIYPLNSGLLTLNEEFNRDDIFKYLSDLNGNYGYFSEQSSFEYAFRKQNARALDPRQFIIDTSDQFDFSYKHYPDDIAMRHYTGPVRHKMWQKNWKWHFGL